MTAYKIELIVFDPEDSHAGDVKALLENNRFLSVSVRDLKRKAIPDWNDDHPLNKCAATDEQVDSFFAEA